MDGAQLQYIGTKLEAVVESNRAIIEALRAQLDAQKKTNELLNQIARRPVR